MPAVWCQAPRGRFPTRVEAALDGSRILPSSLRCKSIPGVKTKARPDFLCSNSPSLASFMRSARALSYETLCERWCEPTV